MTSFLTIALISLAVATFFSRHLLLQKTLLTVSTVFVFGEIMNGFQADASLEMIRWSIYGIIGVSFLLALIPVLKVRYLLAVVPLIALIPLGAKALFFDFELEWSLPIALLPFFGALVPLVAKLKSNYAQKWFQADVLQVEQAFIVSLLAVLLFVSFFLASYFGVVLLTVGFLSTAFIRPSMYQFTLVFSLLILAWVCYLSQTSTLISNQLLKGNVLMGIVGGGVALLWMRAFSKSSKAKWLGILLPALLLFGMVFLGKLNEHFGGMMSLMGIFVGFALGFLLAPQTELAEMKATIFALPLVMMGLSQPINTYLTPVKLETKSLIDKPVSADKTTKPGIFDLPAIALETTMNGNWKSDLELSKVEFELGPDGNKTSGAFKDFAVKLNMENGKPSTLSVDFKSASLTTFNDLRDESVLGDDYLKTAKFPAIAFKSESIVAKEDRFVATGNLEFLGNKEAVDVEFKFVGTEQKAGATYLVFVGKSLVDRTKFGMKSDAKIGNEVSITFEIAVKQ